MVRFPRISNATDVDAMAGETGVDVQVTTNPDTCQAADVLVLPGSRSTVSDLEWLRRSGIADVVARRAEQGRSFRREAQLQRIQCADKGMQIGTNGVQLLGGHGFIKEHLVELWYRQLRAVGIFEGAVLV